HLIQTFVAMRGRANGTYRLTGCLFAMHTHDGLEEHLRIIQVTLIVIIDTEPVHFPGTAGFNFSDDGDVVLGLTRHHARVASDACTEINRHSPRIVFRRILRIEGQVARRRLLFKLRKVRMLGILTGSSAPHKVTVFHRVMTLRGNERVLSSSLPHSDVLYNPW